MTAESFQKRTLSRRAFVAGLGEIISSVSDLRILRKRPAIQGSFSEKIMLAVTQVNDCRYCSYVHTRKALNAGVSEAEVRSLLDGGLEHSPSDQLIALAFAQHYAEREGHPEGQTLLELEKTYGSETAREILAYIRIIFLQTWQVIHLTNSYTNWVCWAETSLLQKQIVNTARARI